MTTATTITVRSNRPNDAEIDAAILAALAEAGPDDGHPWADIRRQLPGSQQCANDRLIALWHTGAVWVIKVGGRNIVGLGDADDRRLAADNRNRVPLAL